MDETFRWVIGALITVQLAVIGFLARAIWAHVLDCRNVGAAISRIEGSVDRIQRDIGDHETGIRGALHDHGNRLTQHGMRLYLLDKMDPPEKSGS